MFDDAVVARQLGRDPRGVWRVASRCSFGYPTTIATAPDAGEGMRFPTLFYLTCPHLAETISRLESAGAVEQWRERLAADERLAGQLRSGDEAYRSARAVEGGGTDPTPGVGIAGQKDPLATKCLHAHVAALLAGIDDPVGNGVLAELDAECSDRRCGEGT